MFKYFIKRLLFAALALFVLLVLVFFLMQAVPGFPIPRENNDTDASYLEKVRQAGLLDNIFVQFWRFFSGLFTGEGFGIVYSNGASVLDTMLEPIKYTLMIAGPAFLLSSIIGILLGIVSAYYRGKWLDIVINTIAVLFISIPSFVFALYLIQLAGLIGLPTNFIVPGSDGATTSQVILSMIIPILSMTLSSISVIIYYTRNELVEVFKQEYIKTALAKGYKFRTVVFRYAFRNGAIPIISILAPSFVTVLSGSIIIEKFFNVPGTANELVNAITKKEFNIVLFSAVFYSSIYFIIQILADISYSFIDPRIVLAEKSSVNLWKKIESKFNRELKSLLFDKFSFLNGGSHLNKNISNEDIHQILVNSKLDLNKITKNDYALIQYLLKNENVSFDNIKNNINTIKLRDVEKLVASDLIDTNNGLYQLKPYVMNALSSKANTTKNAFKFYDENNVNSSLMTNLSSRLRYQIVAKSLIDNSVQELDTKGSDLLFTPNEDDEELNIITQKGVEQNVNYEIAPEMFNSVDIFSSSPEQIAGKPTTYLKDLGRRFFKSKTATFFTCLLSFIILFSIITSLVNLNTIDDPISLGIPSSIIAYLPPRIPWLGISGITTIIVDADTFNAINALGINGMYEKVEQIGSQFQLVNFNPYVIPGLENTTLMLGTDGIGRNWWNLLWFSTLQSLVLATLVAFCSVFIGTIYGSIAGSKAGKMTDVVMMRIVEILSGVPLILWILIFGLVFSGGNLSLPVVGISLILVSWMWPSITARTFIIKYKDAEFVQAAKTLGASETRILFSHLLPNVAGRLVVIMVNLIPRVIFFEASLVFLGVRSATDISLGSMIETARLNPYLYLLLGPTIMIVLITLSAQLISNHLNDSLDPKVSGE